MFLGTIVQGFIPATSGSMDSGWKAFICLVFGIFVYLFYDYNMRIKENNKTEIKKVKKEKD